MGKRKRSGSFSKYDDYSKKSDDGDSQEELDGEPGGSQRGNLVNGIRYSARVQEKQEKLRREASPSKQTILDTPSTSTISVHCPSTVKAIIGDDSVYVYPFENPFISHSVGSSGSGEKKKKRTWELWSQEDKQLFFEALNDFGKDFDSIQNYLASKLKPRSKASCAQYVPKNKDQVRHFYYRTWNKISKYLTFPKDMKKAYQELYGLINYGELRKKQRVLNLKTAVKLSELVERGTTTIKVRGKTFRIKTPVCRALKKLNQLEEIDHIRVPCKLCVELVPFDGNTWASVQRVSHNPRVKLYVPLQRTLASLIIYFEERWKTDHNRLKEEFSLSIFGKPRTRLRFIPVESRDLRVPIFKFSEVTSATKISLSSYVQNCLYQERKDESMLVSKKFKRKPKLGSETGFCSGSQINRDSDYLAAEADVSDADGCEVTPENQFRITLRRDKFLGSTLTTLRTDEFMDQDNSNGLPDNAMWSVHEENANAATETDVGETDYGFDENLPSPTECDENTCDEDCMDHGIQENMIYQLHDNELREDKQGTCSACKSPDIEECGTPEKSEKLCTCGVKKAEDISVVGCPSLDSETIARGWSAEDAGALTVGEIYLMLGKCDKLCFEYLWDKCEEDTIREERARNLVGRLVSAARHLKKRKSSRGKTTVSNASATSTGGHYICTKCTVKTESLSTIDSESGIHVKDLYESPLLDSSPRTTQNDSHDENKITLHAAPNSPLEESPIKAETEQNDSVIAEAESNVNLNLTSTIADKQEAVQTEIEPLGNQSEESSTTLEPIQTDNILSTDQEASTSIAQSVVTAPSSQSSQTGLIEITATSNSLPELDRGFIRAASNIAATILPAPPTIIRSVAISHTPLQDVQKTTLCTTLTPVTVTNTVLISKPAVFTGLAAEAPSFVSFQPCTNTATALLPLPPASSKPQDSKFRRPADIPIAMKPSTDDRTINEDGSSKVSVPKPFLDLPKGNRRIGRRPAWKQRVIIPRMLPLLPKPDESMLKATIIAIPPLVTTGLSVVPVVAENFSPVATLPVSTADLETSTTTSSLSISMSSTITLPSNQTSASSSSVSAVTSSSANLPVPDATSFEKHITATNTALQEEKPTSSKNSSEMNSTISSRAVGPGCYEETLDNLSLSSFMDISLPESTRFLASDLRLEELECSETSISLNLPGLYENNKSNPRDPPLLETPKKQPGNEDSQLTLSSPQRLTPMETSWSNMNEVYPSSSQSSDLFMGGLFSGSQTLHTSTNESLSGGDLNFQSVMGENSLNFETKLNDFTVHITDSNKDKD